MAKQLVRRLKSLKLDKDELVRRVLRDYDDDLQDRSAWAEKRAQRYAKFRGWLEQKDYPWPGANNAHIPVIATDVLRTEDTLHNAVLSIRPVMSAVPLDQKDHDKGEIVDDLVDYQVFIENKGEISIGNLISYFVQDGTFVAFVPYIKETQQVAEAHNLGRYDQATDWDAFVLDGLRNAYGRDSMPKREQEFQWTVTVEHPDTHEFEPLVVDLYVDEEDQVQAVAKRTIKTFDGPCLIPVDLEDILAPTRCANLQPRTLSNPLGAPHVIHVSVTSLDEVRRLTQMGEYDLLTEEDLKSLEEANTSANELGGDPNMQKVLKDELAGQYHGSSAEAKQRVTRLTWYGAWDVDGDGLDEQVIVTMLREPKKICRVKLLTEQYPAMPPRRPFAMGKFLEVPGQLHGIGLIELLEDMYDLLKSVFDQALDAGELANTPFGFYRASSNMTPGIIRFMPGEMYPVANPGQDINFPTLPHQDQSFRLNVMTVLGQLIDQLSMVGELQLGRVPQGKASALRTTSGMMSVLQQGDARPERILRRFFMGLSEVWQQFHELNKAFLPKGKQFRIVNAQERQKDPYAKLDDLSTLKGRFEFDFKANILNTNKALKGQVLTELAGILMNGMTFQMGLVDPVTAYHLLKEIVKSKGQDPNKLIKKPTPDVDAMRISWQDAVLEILAGRVPEGIPQEGAQVHLQKLLAFMNSDNFGYFKGNQVMLFGRWLQQVQAMVQQEAQLAAQAQQFAQGMGAGGMMPGQVAPPQGLAGNSPVGPGELMDESMPMAGGGGQPGMMM